MNEVRLEGRITKDFDCRGAEGKENCFFTVACDREFSAAADFVPVKAFGSLAKSCAETLKKGTLVSVVGRVGTGSYEKDGEKVFTTTVIAETVRVRRTESRSLSASVVIEDDEENAAEVG